MVGRKYLDDFRIGRAASVKQIDQITDQRIRCIFGCRYLADINHFPGVLFNPHEHALACLGDHHGPIKHGVSHDTHQAPHLAHGCALAQTGETSRRAADQFFVHRIVTLTKHPQKCNLESKTHAPGQYFVSGLITLERLNGKTGTEIRPLLDIDIKKTGFGIGFFPAGCPEIVDNRQQEFGMIFPLLVVVLHVTAKDKQCAVQCGQQDIFIVIGTNRYVVGHGHRFLAKQGSAPQLHENENAPKLVDEIHTVLEILTPFAVFLKAFKAGFCLLDGLFYFTLDQIKRLRFRRKRRLNHKRFPLTLRRLPHPL